jgi:N-acetyl sugar amidotransferase|tara:strand:+ start:48206 stop:49285 length:1080 start_codon:yes stop_codon:yes gene_type:complete
MDTSDPDIEFDKNGFCNHCRSYFEYVQAIGETKEYAINKLTEIVETIKRKRGGKEYDSILGISGGIDSSFTAYSAKKLGLRPLLVHFDNGWNSELSVRNIENIVKKLDFDLYTYVIDWEEFKDLQKSFLKASVVDIEMLTDHAIMATMFRLARKHKIKYVLSGENIATEFILPKTWMYIIKDIKNIKGIQRIFGTRALKSFPVFGIYELILYRYIYKLEYIKILNYIDYNKDDAIRIMEEELDWKYYGGKHYESIFTKFYQAYILPAKFGIDKRKAHLSNLIVSGQIAREDALKEMTKILYDPTELDQDIEYVIKKLCFTADEFKQIMADAPKSHFDYPNSKWLIDVGRKIKGYMGLKI